MQRRPGEPRYFSLEEANAALPRVRRILETLRARAGELVGVQVQMAALSQGARRMAHGLNGHSRALNDALRRAEALANEIRGLLAELEQIGCELKDIQQGLVDFRTVREGRPVYLCWRLGEDEIRFWHELDTGFGGRQPL